MTNNDIISTFISNAIALLETHSSVLYEILQKYKLLPIEVVITTKDDAINYFNNIGNYLKLNKSDVIAKMQNAANDIANATIRIKKLNTVFSYAGLETIDIIKRKIYEYKTVINRLKNENHFNREAQIKAYDQALNPTSYSNTFTQTEQEYRDTQFNRYKIFTLNWQQNSEKIARLESEMLKLQRLISER